MLTQSKISFGRPAVSKTTDEKKVQTGEYYDAIQNNIDTTWKSELKSEFEKPYWSKLITTLNSDYKLGKQIFPPRELIFNALNKCPLNKVKVVVIAQDPYIKESQAEGLCFSVPLGIEIPPSLINVFRELRSDIPGFIIPNHGNLNKWAEQGILMLNSTLTVESGKPNSHATYGWENLTSSIIKVVDQKCDGVVFLLWGAFAQKKGSIVNTKKHLVLKAPHPSPNSPMPFLSCKHFSKTNDYLLKNGKTPINWQV